MPLDPKAKLNAAVFEGDVAQRPIRDGYGEGLARAGETNRNVVALPATLAKPTRNKVSPRLFPDRFFEIGVAEQNMAAIAAGLGVSGKIPFISSYAVFSPGRNWEQIRTTIAYNDSNVKIAGHHAGVSVGPDGATHQALEDIAAMRAMPNMKVIVPCDAIEARKAQATIVACGPLLHQALLAARELEKNKIGVSVLNSHTVKPLDEEAIIGAARRTGAGVTVEEHQIAGGLGGGVAELLARRCPVPVEFVGIGDSFGESGTPEELWRKFGLTAKDIRAAVKRALRRKARTVPPGRSRPFSSR